MILVNLQQQQNEIEDLERRRKENPQDAELEQLLLQLKEKVNMLIVRTNQGISLVKVNITYFIKLFFSINLKWTSYP